MTDTMHRTNRARFPHARRTPRAEHTPATPLDVDTTAQHYAARGDTVWILANEPSSTIAEWNTCTAETAETAIDAAWNVYSKRRMLDLAEAQTIAVLISPRMYLQLNADARQVANRLRTDGHRFGVHCEITVDDEQGRA